MADGVRTEWAVSLPDADPRFADMLAYLRGVRVAGRGSPVPRMLGEWALLGYLLQSGTLTLRADANLTPTGDADLAEGQAAARQLTEQAANFDFD